MEDRRTRLLNPLICALILIMLCNGGCSPEAERTARLGCARCHRHRPDKAHDLGCTVCHGGKRDGVNMQESHEGLISKPASARFMERNCGKCHPGRTEAMKKASHFTIKNEAGRIWNAFFPGEAFPDGFFTIPLPGHPDSPNEIVMDMMRRRCMRCHLHHKGDDYDAATHGEGCAACHVRYMNGELYSHSFTKTPDDETCLACHYGNFTGWDYYGRYEQDYPDEFRAPLKHGRHRRRPWGINWHQMTPDIHAKAGFRCTGCHNTDICFNRTDQAVKPDCHGCHSELPGFDENTPGHDPAGRMLVDCSACHAVWTYNDMGRSLLRQDDPDRDDWTALSVQGSSEVESFVKGLKPSDSILMTDKFNINAGHVPGIWFEGFESRRWYPVVLGEGCDGRLHVARPLLDISISYLDGNDDVIFNNLVPPEQAECTRPYMIRKIIYPDKIMHKNASRPWLWLPYIPHTTGKADYFRTMAVIRWIRNTSKAPVRRHNLNHQKQIRH